MLSMHTPVRLAFTSLCCCLACGCATGGDGDVQLPDNVECSDTTPAYEDVGAFDMCVACHSSSLTGAARAGAPPNINFDTEAGAQAHAEEAVSEVNKGDMPPRGFGTPLTEAQKEQLYEWAMCGM